MDIAADCCTGVAKRYSKAKLNSLIEERRSGSAKNTNMLLEKELCTKIRVSCELRANWHSVC